MSGFDYSKTFDRAEMQRRIDELVFQFERENRNNFPDGTFDKLDDRLHHLTDSEIEALFSLELKKPNIALLYSITLGLFGVDRHYVGDKHRARFKLFTLGALGLWYIFDWFRIRKVARDRNLDMLLDIIKKYEDINSLD